MMTMLGQTDGQDGTGTTQEGLQLKLGFSARVAFLAFVYF